MEEPKDQREKDYLELDRGKTGLLAGQWLDRPFPTSLFGSPGVGSCSGMGSAYI